MNENPEGTPNPLNQNPGAAAPAGSEPVVPVEQPVAPQPVAPAPEPSVEPHVPVEPSAEPAQGDSSVVVDKPKKKAGLIIAIILFIVAIAGGVAAALIVLNPFAAKKDAVPAAITKLVSGKAPKIMVMEGNVNLTATDDTSPFTSLTVKFKSGINGNNSTNFANASITATLSSGAEFSFDADEVRVEDGTLYLKLSNIVEALDNYNPSTETINCIGIDGANCEDYEYIDIDCDEDDEDCEDVDIIMPDPTDSILDFVGVFEVIEDEWIKIPMTDFSNVSSLVQVDDSAQCLIDAAGKMDEYSDEIGKLYEENSFVNYTTDNVRIAQKKSTLYQLKFDAEKLTDFANSMSNSGFANELLACTGGKATNKDISSEYVSQVIEKLPDIYVEIDNDDNFTRVYLTMNNSDGNINVTADLSLSYPTELNISEPEVYIDINEVLSRLLNMFYGDDVYDDDYDYDYDL